MLTDVHLHDISDAIEDEEFKPLDFYDERDKPDSINEHPNKKKSAGSQIIEDRKKRPNILKRNKLKLYWNAYWKKKICKGNI